MNWTKVIEEFYEKLWKKPLNKWVKIAILTVAIAIVTWLTTSCATWYVHKCAAVSNNDTIEIIHEYRSNVEKK